MPVYNQDGEVSNIVVNEQDGQGEQEVSRVYVNEQDGQGEQLVWQRQQWVCNFDGDGGIVDFSSRDADASETQAAAHDGTYGLTQDGFGINLSFPGDGLPAYPGPGDRFHYWLRFDTIGSEDYMSVGFAANASDEMIRLEFDEDRGSMIVTELHPDGNNQLADSLDDGYTGWGGTSWWRPEPTWKSDGTVNVRLYDASNTEVYRTGDLTPSYSWDQGGIELRGPGAGGVTHFDSLLISEPDAY